MFLRLTRQFIQNRTATRFVSAPVFDQIGEHDATMSPHFPMGQFPVLE